VGCETALTRSTHAGKKGSNVCCALLSFVRELLAGFDPWDVSARALADLIEKEKVSSYRPTQLPVPALVQSASLNHFHSFHPRLKLMPPGFTPNGFPPNTANMRHPG